MNKDSIIAIIKRRSSWRSYDGNSPIPYEILNKLKEYISSKTQVGPFGNHARFEIVKIPEVEKNKLNSEYGTYGFIKGAEFFLTGAIQKNNKALEDFGYLLEHIILKATELNLGTCWLGGTFKRSTFARDIDLKNGEMIPAITPIGIPSKNRRVLGKLIRLAARAKIRKPWTELFFTNTFESIKSENIDKALITALESVRLAPSAKNKQPWRIVVDDDKSIHFFIRIESRAGHVLNYQKLDIGIALCHFELTMRNFEKEGKWKTLELEFPYDSNLYHYVASWIGRED